MPVSSAACTHRLPNVSNSSGSFAARIGGWRRAFLAVGLFVVAFSIVGMHQLSLNHELAAPSSSIVSAAAATNVGHQHSSAHDHDTAGHVTGAGSASLGDVEYSGQPGPRAVDPPNGSFGDGHENNCPGCSSHSMAFGACLLAFTLLVLSWWLAPPRARLLPPRLLARPLPLITPVRRRVPPLSLTELSILRT